MQITLLMDVVFGIQNSLNEADLFFLRTQYIYSVVLGCSFSCRGFVNEPVVGSNTMVHGDFQKLYSFLPEWLELFIFYSR